MKNGQILNFVIKYFWQLVRTLLKKHQYRRHFEAVVTEDKFAISERYKIN